MNKVHNVLGIVLLAGILCHGAGLVVAELLFPPENLSVVENPDAVQARIKLLKYTYNICMTCVFCFFVGNLDLCWRCFKERTEADLQKWMVYYLKLIAAMLICTGIFTLMDMDNWQNYFFPLWSALGVVIILLVLPAGAWLIKRNKKSSGENAV